MQESKTIWSDRKRPFFGLPWSFTTYTITDEKVLIRTGILRQREEEIRLYRIMDVTLNRSLMDRIFGVGTIHCCSADKSTPEFDIQHIKDSLNVKNLLSDMIEAQRAAKRVSSREFMQGEDDGFDGLP